MKGNPSPSLSPTNAPSSKYPEIVLVEIGGFINGYRLNGQYVWTPGLGDTPIVENGKQIGQAKIYWQQEKLMARLSLTDLSAEQIAKITANYIDLTKNRQKEIKSVTIKELILNSSSLNNTIMTDKKKQTKVSSLKQILEVHEMATRKVTAIAMAKLAADIIFVLGLMKLVQPKIEGIHTGMGTWSFNGTLCGTKTKEWDGPEEEGQEWETSDESDIESCIKEPPRGVEIPLPTFITELLEIMDAAIGDLNASTFQNGFTSEGVVFIYSSKTPKNTPNPFKTPFKEYFTENNEYYDELIRVGVPVVLIDEETWIDSLTKKPKA